LEIKKGGVLVEGMLINGERLTIGMDW